MSVNIKEAGQKQTELLRQAFEQNKLAHSYLFVDANEIQALNTEIGRASCRERV